jgi:hypothetical protein
MLMVIFLKPTIIIAQGNNIDSDISEKDFLKSFPVWGGRFSNNLMHHTEWIMENNKILKTVSWMEKRTKTTVNLDDTEFWDYDEERDTKFYYRGQIISPERNLDLESRTFTYIKRQLFIELNQINSENGNYNIKTLFFIDNAEFININNIEIFKTTNGKEYLFIYLRSGEQGLDSGLYCYKMDNINSDNPITNLLEPNHIYINMNLRIPENLNITDNMNLDNNLILTMMKSVGRTKISLINYFLDFKTFNFTEKEVYSSNYVISMPKIIQNNKHKIICFKERMEKNRANLYFGLLHNDYDEIIEEFRNGFYLYDTPSASRMNYIERDNGISPSWINQDEIIFSVSFVAHVGNSVRAAGINLYIYKFNIITGKFSKKLLMPERPNYVYLNFKLNYFPDTDIFYNIWIAESDTNLNGYPDRDVFLTYGRFDDNKFETVNLSNSPRSEWSPQLIIDNKGTQHYLWLVEHPKFGYQFYYRNNNEDMLANITDNLNLPLYGDTPETIFTGIFYIILTIGLGIFEGTVLNGLILIILLLLIIVFYKLVPHITHNTHLILLLLFSMIIILSYGLNPLTFPINNPNLSIFIGGCIFGLISLFLIDKVFYRKKIHSPAETAIKLWFFSILLSIYVNYNYISTFIESNMVVRITG